MTMATIPLTDEKLALLQEMAIASGRSATDVLTEVVARSLADVQAQRERLEQALRSRAQGRGISHQQAMEHLARIRRRAC